MKILGQPGLCCSEKGATEQKGGKRKGGKGGCRRETCFGFWISCFDAEKMGLA